MDGRFLDKNCGDLGEFVGSVGICGDHAGICRYLQTSMGSCWHLPGLAEIYQIISKTEFFKKLAARRRGNYS